MGLSTELIAACERLCKDYDCAHRGIKGQSWEMPVDGGRSAHGAHFLQVQASTRLRACLAEVGRRNYEIAIGVIQGATAQTIHARGGNQHVVVKADIVTAMMAVDAFYHGTTRRKDRTWEAFESFNAERAEMIERAEREVG
jgi:hypothetical protein